MSESRQPSKPTIPHPESFTGVRDILRSFELNDDTTSIQTYNRPPFLRHLSIMTPIGFLIPIEVRTRNRQSTNNIHGSNNSHSIRINSCCCSTSSEVTASLLNSLQDDVQELRRLVERNPSQVTCSCSCSGPSFIPPPPPLPPLPPSSSSMTPTKKRQQILGTADVRPDMTTLFQEMPNKVLKHVEKSPGGTPIREKTTSNDLSSAFKKELQGKFASMKGGEPQD